MSARSRRQPRESPAFREWIAQAWEATMLCQERLHSSYKLASYERYDWDQDIGVIVFSTAGAPRLVADAQVVGSISLVTGTWLWGWDNASVDRALTRDAEQMRQIGERDGHPKLTTAKWPAAETDGWEMASLQAQVTAADGVYRAPTRNGLLFLTLKNVRRPGSAENT